MCLYNDLSIKHFAYTMLQSLQQADKTNEYDGLRPKESERRQFMVRCKPEIPWTIAWYFRYDVLEFKTCWGTQFIPTVQIAAVSL